MSKGCEHCQGVYGLEVYPGEYECPLCGAKTEMHYFDYERRKKMEAKIQKTFILTVGTNEDGKTEEDLIAKATELVQYGNSNLNVRFHIFAKEEEEEVVKETTEETPVEETKDETAVEDTFKPDVAGDSKETAPEATVEEQDQAEEAPVEEKTEETKTKVE